MPRNKTGRYDGRTKFVVSLIAIAISVSVADGQPMSFTDNFDGPSLDPAWLQNGDPNGHPTAIAGSYDITDAHGQPGTALNRPTGGTVSSFTHEIDLVLESHLLSGAGGTLSDFKFRSIGADGILDIVYNSFGHIRVNHADFNTGSSDHIIGGSPDNISIGYADGDILGLSVSYDDAADTIDVSYSLNGEAPVSIYAGTGIDGQFGDVITSSVEVLIFKFGDATPDQTVASIDRWSLSTDGTSVVDGDFNSDGLWDCADIDSLVAGIVAGSNSPAFDMNGDGAVTADDVTDASAGWLTVGGANNAGATGGAAFLVADANLDGAVDVSDLNIWNSNKFAMNAAWCSGDFNMDGFVDVSDLNIWNNFKFQTSDAVAVPEPGGLSMIMILGLLLPFTRSTVRPSFGHDGTNR